MGWEANWLENECSASKAVLLLGSRLESLPGSASSSEEDWPIQPWAGDGQHRDALCMASSQSSAVPAATDPAPPWTTKLGSDFSALSSLQHPVHFPEQLQRDLSLLPQKGCTKPHRPQSPHHGCRASWDRGCAHPALGFFLTTHIYSWTSTENNGTMLCKGMFRLDIRKRFSPREWLGIGTGSSGQWSHPQA